MPIAYRDTDVGRFGRWAHSYNESYLQHLLLAPVQEFTLQAAARAYPSPRAILDIGCGTGLLLKRAARRFPAAELTGVDAAREMIRIAQAAVTAGTRIHFQQACAEKLPFPDASFELVLTTMSFHHWADQGQALHEVRRVLVPGGAFALADVLPEGWLSWLLARGGDGRFNDPATLATLVRKAGLKPQHLLVVPHFAGTVKVALTRTPRA